MANNIYILTTNEMKEFMNYYKKVHRLNTYNDVLEHMVMRLKESVSKVLKGRYDLNKIKKEMEENGRYKEIRLRGPGRPKTR